MKRSKNFTGFDYEDEEIINEFDFKAGGYGENFITKERTIKGDQIVSRMHNGKEVAKYSEDYHKKPKVSNKNSELFSKLIDEKWFPKSSTGHLKDF